MKRTLNGSWCLVVATVLVMGAERSAQGGEQYAFTLNEAVGYALANNPGVVCARAQVNEARSGIVIARSSLLPALTLEGSYTRIGQPASISLIPGEELVFSQENSWQGRASVAQPLFSGGRLLTMYQIARLRWDSTREAYERAKEEIAAQVALAYHRLQVAKEMEKLTRESYEQIERHVSQTEELYRNGLCSKLDYLRIQVELANSKPQLSQARNTVILAEESFKEILGLPTDSQLTLKDSLSYEKHEVGLSTCLETAFANRSDLKQASIACKLAKKNKYLALTGNFPQLSFIYNYSYQRPYNFEDEWGGDWAAMVNLSFPLFSGFRTYGKLGEARSQVVQAQTNLQALKRRVEVEVKQAFLELRQAEETIESQKENVDAASEMVKLAEERYRNGLATNLEYLDAELALTRARTNHLKAIADYLDAWTALQKARGLNLTMNPEGTYE